MKTTAIIDAEVARLEAEGRVADSLRRPAAAPAARFTLPIPPSVNNLFANGKKGRYRTAAYEEWSRMGIAMLAAQRVGVAQVPCRVVVTIRGGPGFSKLRDIDNTLKPVLDLLVNAGVLPGDNVTRVYEVTARYVGRDNSQPASCDVEIQTISPEAHG